MTRPQKSWSGEDKYAVLTHVGKPKREGDPQGRWEVELTRYFDSHLSYTRQRSSDTVLGYHRTWLGARYRILCFMEPTHLAVSMRTVIRLMWALSAVGIFLAVLGLRAAYGTVGFHSAAGVIITTAIVVESLTLVATLLYVHRRYYPKEKK